MTAKQKFVVKEYFCCQSNLARYEWGDKLKEFSHRLFKLISDIHEVKGEVDKCWEMIDKVGSIQDAAELKMITSMKMESFSADEALIMGFKSDILSENDTSSKKSFDYDIVFSEVKELADMGTVSGCKLWAYINWLAGDERSQKISLEWWEILAVGGDIPSVKALEYAYDEIEQGERSLLWREVREILSRSDFIVTPLSICEEKKFSKEATELAELIVCIKTKRASSKADVIDKYMSYYALKSRDDIGEKIRKLTFENNFYMVLFEESRVPKRNTVGFASGM